MKTTVRAFGIDDKRWTLRDLQEVEIRRVGTHSCLDHRRTRSIQQFFSVRRAKFFLQLLPAGDGYLSPPACCPYGLEAQRPLLEQPEASEAGVV